MKQTMTDNFSIGFIGAGNMASALVGGMIANGFPSEKIMLSDINEQQLQALEKVFGINTTTNNETLIEKNDIVVLALKPQVMQSVLEPLVKKLQEKKPLIISIAAGVTINSLNTWSSQGLAIIRCMPNTPALVKLGASGLFANEKVNNIQKNQAEAILKAVGIVEWLEQESQIDAVTALSGSGPAYFFLMIESMIAAGVAQGLSKESATELTLQTALGAATMAKTSDVDVSELRRRVTSPHGTTEAAINSFKENNYQEIINQAVNAAFKRSVELSKK
jgi:pyrroline-5-carboxylate reductase